MGLARVFVPVGNIKSRTSAGPRQLTWVSAIAGSCQVLLCYGRFPLQKRGRTKFQIIGLTPISPEKVSGLFLDTWHSQIINLTPLSKPTYRLRAHADFQSRDTRLRAPDQCVPPERRRYSQASFSEPAISCQRCGNSAIESSTNSGRISPARSSGRNLPVRTSTPAIPAACAPAISP